MALSEVQIRNAKRTTRLVKLSDGSGLQLHTPEGSKLWPLAYRFGGNKKKLAFGRDPDISLQEARERRAAAKDALASGKAPGVIRKVEKQAAEVASRNTFSSVAEDLIAKKRRGKGRCPLAKNEWLLGFARKHLGSWPVSQISSPEVLAPPSGRGAPGEVRDCSRLSSRIGQVFRLAIAPPARRTTRRKHFVAP